MAEDGVRGLTESTGNVVRGVQKMKMTGRDGTIEVEGVAYKGHSDRVMSHSVKQQNLSLSPSVSVCVFRTITLSTICLFAVTAKTEMTGSRSLLPAARGKKARLNIRVRMFFAVPACVCPRLLFFFLCLYRTYVCVCLLWLET